MRSYIVKGTYTTIYDGEIFPTVDEAGREEYTVNLKQYHVYDANTKFWETWPVDDVHKSIYLSKQMRQGRLQEFPSLESAQRFCNGKLR